MRIQHELKTALDELRRTCIQSLLLCATILAATVTTLSAQTLTPIGARSSGNPGANTLIQGSDRPGPDPSHARRIVPAALGGLAGAVALGAIGVGIGSGGAGDGYGGLVLGLYGATLGGILGSATGAAAPTGRGLCTGAQRFGMGVGGALLGAVAGLSVAMVAPPLAFGLLATIPIGSIAFMRRC